MKTMFLFRGSWQRKDKKLLAPASSTSDSEQFHSEVPLSPLPKPPGYHSPSFHTLQFESCSPIHHSCEDSDDPCRLPSGSSDQAKSRVSSEGEKLETHRTHIRLNGNYGALSNTTHGPPQNSLHGPPHFSRIIRPNTAPSRPPRPPSLDLYSHPRPMSATQRSPNRVRFAPVPQIRPPDSPSRHSFRHVGQTKAYDLDPVNGAENSTNSERSAYLKMSQDSRSASHLVGGHQNREILESVKLGGQSSSASVITATSPPSPSYVPQEPHGTVHAFPDFPDIPSSCSPYYPTSSNAHLPVVKDMPPPKTSKNDMQSGPPSALSPPPPIIRKRPKPLVLLPAPTIARLSPSPAFPPSPGCSHSPSFSSADSTPPTTPITPRPLHLIASNKAAQRSPGRYLSSVPPPTYSPPTTPLPTPPISPNATLGTPPSRQLRSAHSTADFRSHHLYPSGGHRTILSASPPDPHCPTRRRTQSRPDFLGASSHLHTKEVVPKSHTNSHIQWGYAL